MANNLSLFLAVIGLTCCALASSDAIKFRSLFAANCARHNHTLQDSNGHSFALLPTASLDATKYMSSFGSVVTAFMASSPSECQSAADAVETAPAANPLASLVSRNKPVTIFFIANLASEVFGHLPFDEAYNNQSTFAKAYASALAASPKTTTVWDNSLLSDVEVPFGEIVKASSVDLPNGTPLYQLVWFTQRDGSLESFEDYRKSYPRMVSRISIFLDIVGDSVEEFVVVGFSRGAIDALEWLSRRDEIPWGDKYKGVIALEGVVWGTTLSDCAMGHYQNKAVCSSLTKIRSALNTLASLKPGALNFVGNLIKLAKAIVNFDSGLASMPFPKTMVSTTLYFPDLVATWKEMVRDLILSNWDISHLLSGYNDNIRRTVRFCEAAIESLNMFTTADRIAWFSNHTIPSDALYLSLSSTMWDASYSYPTAYPDWYGMRFFYYIMNSAVGDQIMDGAVPVSHQVFLPALHMELNPNQAEYSSHWLGLFHANHASPALVHVVPANIVGSDQQWVDPFPRLALLDSIAAWVASSV